MGTPTLVRRYRYIETAPKVDVSTDGHVEVSMKISPVKESNSPETLFVALFKRLADTVGFNLCVGIKRTTRMQKLGLTKLASIPDLICYLPRAMDHFPQGLFVIEVKKNYPRRSIMLLAHSQDLVTALTHPGAV